MKFSKKTEYGLLALIDMAVQQERTPGARLTTHDIAVRQGIPERFLEQQMTVLRNAGLVHSQRGAAGGCSLARRPDAISVLEVIEALEGAILEPGEDDAARSTEAVREVIARAQTALHDLFATISITDLAHRQVELEEQSCEMFYV